VLESTRLAPYEHHVQSTGSEILIIEALCARIHTRQLLASFFASLQDQELKPARLQQHVHLVSVRVPTRLQQVATKDAFELV